jgi:hypothetical protein
MRTLLAACLFFLTLFNLDVQANNTLPIIHVIGDSHSREFSQIPGCVIQWIESVTMHRVGRDGFSAIYLPAFGVKEEEVAVFTFGEIDARCHIGRQRDLFNQNVDDVIETLAIKYLNTILQNRLLYNKVTCIVYSVTPPTYRGGCNLELPFYGSIEDRIMITKKLNARLADLCAQVGILFLDVYNDYAGPDGTLNTALSDGSVHINAACSQFIQAKLYQLIMNNSL